MLAVSRTACSTNSINNSVDTYLPCPINLYSIIIRLGSLADLRPTGFHRYIAFFSLPRRHGFAYLSRLGLLPPL